PDTKTSDYIFELISMGYSSIARDNGIGNLEIYKKLEQGLDFLNNNVTVVSDDVVNCVVLLKLLISLREKVIISEDVPAYEIPHIHKSAESFKELLIKSALSTIKNQDQELITRQWEAFFKAADEIRNEQELRGLGVLDRELKNVIERLREESEIDSVFFFAENKFFENYKAKAETIMHEGSLKEIGKKILEMKNITNKDNIDSTQTNRFLKYLRKYEARFISKIKSQMNLLNKKSLGASFYNIQENIEELSSFKNLEIYHKKTGLTFSVKRLIKYIQKQKIEPFESVLSRIINFLEKKNLEYDWKDYINKYELIYKETDIFSDSFYTYTLKGLTSREAVDLLQGKKEGLKAMELDKIAYINYEKEVESFLGKLIHVYQGRSDLNGVPGRQI
ncbi:MAG: hypothetical protein GY860_21770, partial [Desulfobacteraceae bacterium]|nr:hypothetical protein [Desulfobacteraceae bacterium]